MSVYNPRGGAFVRLQVAVGEWIEAQPDLSALREYGYRLTVYEVSLQAAKAALAVITLAADVANRDQGK
jgi:hypothetical protein